jgi:sigma-E factor negative regulatory protein RseA
MNNSPDTSRDEKISALLDDALEQQELDAFMQDLKRDEVHDAEQIQRYQIMGDALRDDLSESSFMDISSAVHRAIEQEPEINVTVQKTKAKLFYFSAFVRPLTGMAVAASVAMVTVVAFRTVETESAGNPVQAVAQVQQQIKNNTARITPVDPAIARQVRVASTAELHNPHKQQEKQLSDYMMNHSGYAGQTTMQGMMPYVRVVSFDAEGEK